MPNNPEKPGNDNGNDPRDTPAPIIYGEEIDDISCRTEFVDGIGRNLCNAQEANVPKKYKGELLYLLFPDTQWSEGEAVEEIIRAQEFYAKYCIFLNFTAATVSAQARQRMKSMYDEWKADFEAHVFPHGTTLSESEKQDTLNNTTINNDFFTRMNRMMIATQNSAGAGKKKGLVVFVDQYIANTGRPNRGSANHSKYFQIGLSYPDKDSPHILSHELIHLLGKRNRRRGGAVTWSHNSPCTDTAMSIALPRRWTDPFDWSGRLLEAAEYEEIQTNRGGRKILSEVR